MLKRIFITPGEPSGIGPDITLSALSEAWNAELIVIADPALLQERAALLDLCIEVKTWDPSQERQAHEPGIIPVLAVSQTIKSEPGKLNAQNAGYVIHTLKKASELCMEKIADGIVTGPVHKGILNDGGFSFLGHTEFFANEAGVHDTVMLFVVNHHKIALVTTHLALSEVPNAITSSRLSRILSILQQGLKHYFHLTHPKILVCGLNPHAGENGYLGREEIEIITPTLQKHRQNGEDLEGPLPADTIFTPPFLKRADAILAMYHDQALPVVKCMGFGNAVNITLGLPFLRTSVDHGTAIDLAGTGKAEADSMKKAIEVAITHCC